jgi:hypothetical protein
VANGVFTPYSTVSGFVAAMPGWVPLEEQERISSYQVYEEIYWNHPEAFRLTLRGTDTKPVYIPSGRIIVDAICRYTAKKFEVLTVGTNADALKAEFNLLFARERFRSKLNSGKKMGAIRGDWLFHVTADDTKPQGSRLSLHMVDPASFFPIYDDETQTRIVRVHLAEQFTTADGNERVRRQTYEKTPQGITTELTIWEPDKWASGDARPLETPVPKKLLPPAITQIPVYHIRNSVTDDLQPYGNSEMRGLERLMASINQSMSDEDLALALEGLGVYKSGNGAPVDDDDEETDWVIGPGRVVEDPTFERVNGISSVAPFLDHVKAIDGYMKEASGTPDVAIGKVDVQVAESGVALALKMAPILSRAEDKETEIVEVLNQMFYDLLSWFSVYEGKTFPETSAVATFGSPLPVNTEKEIDYCVKMIESGIMSTTTARAYLKAKCGIDFASDEFTKIVQEKAALAEAEGPALGEGVGTEYSGRIATEMAGDTAGAPSEDDAE